MRLRSGRRARSREGARQRCGHRRTDAGPCSGLTQARRRQSHAAAAQCRVDLCQEQVLPTAAIRRPASAWMRPV